MECVNFSYDPADKHRSQVEQTFFGRCRFVHFLLLKPAAHCRRVNAELTYELRRFPTLKRALFAVGRALGEREMGRVDVVFVRQAAVDRLTRYLLVPLPICTCYCHRRVRLENKTKVT